MENIYNIGFAEGDGEETPPIKQGSTFVLSFTVSNIFAEGGVGTTLRGQYRTSYGATEAVDFDCTVEVVAAVAETADTPAVESYLDCTGTLSADVTDGMAPGPGVYDFELEDVSGFVYPALGGKAMVRPSASRGVSP